ncbi:MULTISPECIES: ATPase [Thioclava]|uniref:ATPase n=1 Tax=Thioclava nitratireducens TaxID=1915078 RepID=A0ABN4XA95_9RHOB|nr:MULTISPECIES: ATPase [Thioclava]AQS48114.1 ATPase [Thioclava nitratireducens]OWY05145.1 ATPase [Thioclava sp. F1Mire-8]OWY06791.1 ATPase [Thioclava sp. IC9]OWY15522.1 ATPase [Thioclava sp. F34-6]OWY18328.1 ATPase [Thioclava sp. JM3]
MIYSNRAEWLAAKSRKVALFGMSGLGKTWAANLLRDEGWFHYSVDYRIGTRYMGEYIADNFKREAMKNPFLAELLLSDSVYIASNITFENLAPLSTYLGKPGDPTKGGLPFEEYLERQRQHRKAEMDALLDTAHFIDRAKQIYGIENFLCDSGGSICEVVDPDDPEDPILTSLSQNLLMVWIEGSEAHTEELIKRFSRAPKPMYYQPAFLAAKWDEYRDLKGVAETEVDPDDFVRWTYAQALAHRQPRYAAMARNWGVTIRAEDLYLVRDAKGFTSLIADALPA